MRKKERMTASIFLDSHIFVLVIFINKGQRLDCVPSRKMASKEVVTISISNQLRTPEKSFIKRISSTCLLNKIKKKRTTGTRREMSRWGPETSRPYPWKEERSVSLHSSEAKFHTKKTMYMATKRSWSNKKSNTTDPRSRRSPSPNKPRDWDLAHSITQKMSLVRIDQWP